MGLLQNIEYFPLILFGMKFVKRNDSRWKLVSRSYLIIK